MSNRPQLHTLICSTRPGRVSPAFANWAHGQAQEHGKFESTLVDLASFQLPVFDEPHHPRLGRYEHEHTRAWSRSVASADAFLFVMPEYNYSPPSALLNALTYLSREWQYKPVGFVSYGGLSGGLRAVQVAKQMLTTMKMVPMMEAVAVPNYAQHLDAEGRFAATGAHNDAARTMLDELHRWTLALSQLRQPQDTGKA